MGQRSPIRHFETINALHEATGFNGRTDVPDIHVFSLAETYPTTRTRMPPYSTRFYGVALNEGADDALLEFNAERRRFSNTLTFQGPGHVVAWVRGAAQRGYLVLFQPEFLSHLNSLFEHFPFFQPTSINVVALTPADQSLLRALFGQLYATFASDHPYRIPLLQAQLTIVLYESRRLYDMTCRHVEGGSDSSSFVARFLDLVERQGFVRQRVEAYADLLGVTPNYLSQMITSTLGRKASDIIADRVLVEARRLLRYTDLSVADIADQLGFVQATHFTRFFRRTLGVTPFQYRRERADAAVF